MVIIKGFKMPESCCECPICYDTIECPVGPGLFDNRLLADDVVKWYEENPEWFTTKRHLHCPLKELSFDFQPVVLKFNNSISKQVLIDALEKTTIAGILPSVQPEQKRGKWLFCASTEDLMCSNCLHYWIPNGDQYDYHYCPNCGAEMDGDTE